MTIWTILLAGGIATVVAIVGLIYALSALMPMLLDEDQDDK